MAVQMSDVVPLFALIKETEQLIETLSAKLTAVDCTLAELKQDESETTK